MINPFYLLIMRRKYCLTGWKIEIMTIKTERDMPGGYSTPHFIYLKWNTSKYFRFLNYLTLSHELIHQLAFYSKDDRLHHILHVFDYTNAEYPKWQEKYHVKDEDALRVFKMLRLPKLPYIDLSELLKVAKNYGL